MVRVWGANMSDVTDRSSRLLGEVYGYQDCTAEAVKLPIAGNDGVSVSPKKWTSRHGQGEVCFMDDFEDTLKWTAITGTLSKASDAGHVLDGSFAMKLVTGATAGDGASAYVYATPLIYQWEYSNIELWWSISATADATPRDFYFWWSIQDRTNSEGRGFGLRYLNYLNTVQQRKWQYWTSAGAWADFPVQLPERVNTMIPQFNYLMLVVRRAPSAHYVYDLMQSNDQSCAQLKGEAGSPEALGPSQQVVTIGCTTDAAAATTLYVDDFLISNGVYTI